MNSPSLYSLVQRLDRLEREAGKAEVARPVGAVIRTFSLLLAVISTLGCALGGRSPSQEVRSTFERELAQQRQVFSRPYSCDLGWVASQGGYVADIAEWAEQAGLRRGDKITTIAGITVTGREDRVRAMYQVPAGGPFLITVTREGKTESLSLPCMDNSRFWNLVTNVHSAGARGDWEACETAANELLRRQVNKGNPSLWWSLYRCSYAKNRDRGRGPDATEANLLYQFNLTLLRLVRYEPGGLDTVRGTILANVSVLRRDGFPSLAADLENELLKAAQTEVSPTPSSPPSSRAAFSRGTAFLVRSDGTLLTAFHVVESAKSITVKCPDYAPATATLVDTARNNDLAVLRIPLTGMPYLAVARPRALRVGDPVFTVGFPASSILGTEPKFTDGTVSALSGLRGEASVLQMSVPVQPGNSGGPLLTNDGSVVGIVTSTAAVRAFLAITGALPQNINWAVKSEYATPLFDPPAPLPVVSRTEAIERAMKATCMIEASR